MRLSITVAKPHSLAFSERTNILEKVSTGANSILRSRIISEIHIKGADQVQLIIGDATPLQLVERLYAFLATLPVYVQLGNEMVALSKYLRPQ